MNIADILASVTRDHHDALGTVNLESQSSEKQLDLQLLTRAWVSERVTPELLPYPTELMDRMTQRIRDQVRHVRSAYRMKIVNAVKTLS